MHSDRLPATPHTLYCQPRPDLAAHVDTGQGLWAWLSSAKYWARLAIGSSRVWVLAATLPNATRSSCLHKCLCLTKQYNLVPAKGWWCSATGEVTAGLVESNGSPPPGLWLRSPVDRLPRTGISSRTLCSFWVWNYLYLFNIRTLLASELVHHFHFSFVVLQHIS